MVRLLHALMSLVVVVHMRLIPCFGIRGVLLDKSIYLDSVPMPVFDDYCNIHSH